MRVGEKISAEDLPLLRGSVRHASTRTYALACTTGPLHPAAPQPAGLVVYDRGSDLALGEFSAFKVQYARAVKKP